MNAQRRKALTYISERVTALVEELEALKDEEHEYFDNMPENFQQADKGQMAEAAVGELDEAISSIETAVDNLNNAGA